MCHDLFSSYLIALPREFPYPKWTESPSADSGLLKLTSRRSPGMSSLTQTESASPGPLPAARPVKIGLVQINNSFSGQNYLPYSIALLQTYVQKFAVDPGL